MNLGAELKKEKIRMKIVSWFKAGLFGVSYGFRGRILWVGHGLLLKNSLPVRKND
jgi:hypothetical protein